MIARTALVLLAAAFSGCVADAPPLVSAPAAEGAVVLALNADPAQVERGKRIVAMQCVSCHAVHADDKRRCGRWRNVIRSRAWKTLSHWAS